MKYIFTLLLTILISNLLVAQSPEKLSYQAVVRDINGNLISEQTVGIRFSILQSSENGSPAYIETQNPMTNSNGLISLKIGAGVVLNGDFSSIDWANGPFFIKTELDPEGGASYTISGVSQLLSVPYALHAKTAESISGSLGETDPAFIESEASNITAADITNLENLSGVNTGDQDLTTFATKTDLGDSVLQLRGELPDVSGIALNTQAIQDTASQMRADMLQEELDPFYSISIANGITETDTLNWNNKLDNYTETDPKVPVGTQMGQMQYWNGTKWIIIEAGETGQVLSYIDGVPVWVDHEVPDNDTVTEPLWEEVTSLTGRIWMDRNLGASRVATSSINALAYGDLYQWGRAADGHEKRNSSTTSVLSTTDTPGHGDFIITNDWDWRTPGNDNLWQGVNGINNPCPSGFRLPTKVEWEDEVATWSNNSAGAGFNSSLKLTKAGYRTGSGSLSNVGSSGSYWSSTITSTLVYTFSFGYGILATTRVAGLSVRCIKD